MDRITPLALCHPSLIVAQATTTTPTLSEPEYGRQLMALVDLAERLGADDVTITDLLVRDVIVAFQAAAIEIMEEQRW